MISLGLSILIQRLNKVSTSVNAKILIGLSSLALKSSSMDFKSVLQVYNKMGTDATLQDDHCISRAVRAILFFTSPRAPVSFGRSADGAQISDARLALATSLTRESHLYDIYLNDILECIAAIGDTQEPEGKRQVDTVVGALISRPWRYYRLIGARPSS